ncbi:MAG: restriction endonuclease subunit S [Coriobacteriales bacterium]|jgi:type I restriction enzyme S subunit
MTTYRIGDLCTFSKGASVPRARMLEEGDYLYIHYGDLYKGHDIVIDIENPQAPIPYVSSSEKIRKDQFAEDGDIIYVLTSETVSDLGKSLLLVNPQDKAVVSGTETTIVKVNDKKIVEPAYLNYVFQSNRFKKMLRQYVTGMKVFRVHPRDLSRIEISLPEINYQRKTVAILDTIHNQIRLNARLNDYLAA